MAKMTDETKEKIYEILEYSQASGIMAVQINAGELARSLGLYDPPYKNNVKSVCHAMMAVMRAGDEIVSMPPKGAGASLTIRYRTE